MKSLRGWNRCLLAAAVLVLLYLALVGFLHYKVSEGRQAAIGSSNQIAKLLESDRLEEAVAKGLIGPADAEKLRDTFLHNGSRGHLNVEFDTCQMSGTPCLVKITNTASPRGEGVLLYFHNKTCVAVGSQQ